MFFGKHLLAYKEVKAKKGNHCGGEPACVEFYPTQALQYLEREEHFFAKGR